MKRRTNEVTENSIPRYLADKEEKEIPTPNYSTIKFENGKELKVGKQLNHEERKSLEDLLKLNLDNFALRID